MQSHLIVIHPADSAAHHSAATDTPAHDSPASDTQAHAGPRRSIELSGLWSVETTGPNALSIDWCRLAVGGEPLSAPMPTLKAWHEAKRLSALRAGDNRQLVVEYEFDVDADAAVERASMMLVVETAEKYLLSVNGSRVEALDDGWWLDTAFRKMPIGNLVRRGRNTLRLAGLLDSSTEIESVYVIGDFGVRSLASCSPSDRRTVLTDGPFAICAKPVHVASGNLDGGADLTSLGYWFYAGNARLTRSFDLPAGHPSPAAPGATGQEAWLELDPPDAALLRVLVNGNEAGTRGWRPYRFEVGGLLNAGRNTVTLEIFGTLRNLLGPHHHWRGEVLYAGTGFNLTKSPDEDEPEVPEDTWVDRYCMRRFGLAGVPRLRY